MRKILFGVLLTTAMIATVNASAADPTTNALTDDDPFHPPPAATPTQNAPAPLPPAPRHVLRLGFGADLGVPSGLAIGLVVHPMVDWVSLQASFTETYVAPGGRLSVKLDPFALMPRLAIGLFADFQGGFAAREGLPASNLPAVGYDYFNAYLGLRLGRPNGFNWVIELGPTYMHVNTDGFQSVISQSGNSNLNGLTVNNPTVNGWMVPTFVTGFSVVWP